MGGGGLFTQACQMTSLPEAGRVSLKQTKLTRRHESNKQSNFILLKPFSAVSLKIAVRGPQLQLETGESKWIKFMKNVLFMHDVFIGVVAYLAISLAVSIDLNAI